MGGASRAQERGRRRAVRPKAMLLAVAVAVVAACGDGGGAPGASDMPSGEVVLYTSMPGSIVERLELIFEGVFPDLEGRVWVAPGAEAAGGMTLEVVRDSTGPLVDRILEEHAAGGLAADVIWVADPAAMLRLKNAGVLTPYGAPPGTPIPAHYVDPDGYFVAARVINMVIAWNTALIPAGLSDWSDLLENHRRRAFPSPESGAALAAIKALTDAFGDRYFAEYAASGGRQVDNNGVARDAIVAGDYQAAAVLDYMIRQAKEEGLSVDLSYPTSGAVVVPSPIGMTAGAANRDAAEAFVDFVLSDSGQRVLVEIGSFYPVRTDVAPPAGAPPLDTIPQLPVDWEQLVDEVDRLEALWARTF